MKLFLIRHGQTTANVDRIYSGQTDVMLTEQGRQEALALQPVLADIPFDRVYSSDLSRAVHTQQLALPGYTAFTTPCLREYDTGTLTGKPFNCQEGVNRQFRDFREFNGETLEQVLERLGTFIKQLESDPCEYVAAFAHNGVLGCMLQLVLGVQFDTRCVKSDNCAIHVFEYDGQRWKLLAWNYMRQA